MPNPNVSEIGAYLSPQTGVLPSLQAAGAQNGTGLDRTNYGSGVLVVLAGATAGTPTSFTLDAKIQHSADNSTWADYTPPAGSAAITTITAASSLAKVNVNLQGAKQYIRVVLTAAFVGGTSPTIASSAAFVLGGAVNKPTP